MLNLDAAMRLNFDGQTYELDSRLFEIKTGDFTFIGFVEEKEDPKKIKRYCILSYNSETSDGGFSDILFTSNDLKNMVDILYAVAKYKDNRYICFNEDDTVIIIDLDNAEVLFTKQLHELDFVKSVREAKEWYYEENGIKPN